MSVSCKAEGCCTLAMKLEHCGSWVTEAKTSHMKMICKPEGLLLWDVVVSSRTTIQTYLCIMASAIYVKSTLIQQNVWNFSWASLGLPRGLWWADASTQQQQLEWLALCKSFTLLVSVTLEHQINSKAGPKEWDGRSVCSGGTQRITQSKVFSLISSSKILSGLKASYPPSQKSTLVMKL